MIVSLLFLAVGVAVLAFAADALVDGATRLAALWGMSTITVGVVVIGVGTSMPEVIVSIIAAARGDMNAAIGNVAGSNAANMTLLLGVAGLLGGAAATSRTLRREAPLVVAAVAALSVVLWLFDAPLSGRVAGAALVGAGTLTLLVLTRRHEDPTDADLVEEVEQEVEAVAKVRSPWPRVAGGLVGLAVGAQLLLTGALDLADRAGLSSGVAGATIVALGTSLPELAAVLGSVLRRQHELVVGNLLGSNLMNALLVGGVTLMVGGGVSTSWVLLVVPVVATVAGVAALGRGMRVSRPEALMLLTLFAAIQAILLATA